MTHIGAEIHRLNKLKDVPEADLAPTVAYLYDYANFAHPFREIGCAVASRCKNIAR
jgi:cell filamentation protein